MRKPSEYVAAAKAHLRDSLIPDCSEVMRHGERTAKVTRIGSPSVGGEPIMGDEPAENCRVLAMASDFPELSRGEAVELSKREASAPSFHVVTSCTADIAGAGYTVGLSAPFEKCPAAYSGRRRESGRVRELYFPISALVLETGAGGGYADGIAPDMETTYTVAIRRADWPEVSDPEVSDTLRVDGRNFQTATLAVAAVTRHDGWYMLKCRSRGGRNG